MDVPIVKGEGSLNARIAVIGEAPGEQEIVHGRPFVGKSGVLLNRMMEAAGLTRREVYLDNVCRRRPEGNKIEVIPKEEIEQVWLPRIREQLDRMPNLKVVVPVGNLACEAVIPHVMRERKLGTTTLRGSVFKTERGIAIPVIHPAWFLRGQMNKLGRAIADWRRIKYFSETAAPYQGKNFEIVMYPTQADMMQLLKDTSRPMSIDIETPQNRICCVGFGVSESKAYVFPLYSKELKDRYLPMVKTICESPNPKVLHNGLFDRFWLFDDYVDVKDAMYDTMWMHHSLDPADSHSLAYLASIMCVNYQYWKDEAEDEEEKSSGITDYEKLMRYNGKDCCYTLEVYHRLSEAMTKEDRAFYFTHYAIFFEPVLHTMIHGVRVDVDAQTKLRDTLLNTNERIREELRMLTGRELLATKSRVEWRRPDTDEESLLWGPPGKKGKRKFDKAAAKEAGYSPASRKNFEGEPLIGVKVAMPGRDFSLVKLKDWFYGDCGVPKHTKIAKDVTGEKKRVVTVDETALKKIALTSTEEKAVKSVTLILNHRSNKKESDDFDRKWDHDGRMRCTYSFNTEAGRFSSKTHPKGGGRNLQNVKHGVQRGTFLPDPGCVFAFVDGSQVEDRIVKMYTEDEEMMRMANLRPDVFDAHAYNAALIFGVQEKEVTKQQRSLGKMAVHAAQRGMRGNRLADRVLTEMGVAYTSTYCQTLIDKYFAAHEAIREKYFTIVRDRVIRDKKLVNSWGRKWYCLYDQLDDDLYRRAYNFYPQSECNDWMKMRGLLPVWREVRLRRVSWRINLLVHDELVISTRTAEILPLFELLRGSLERPVLIQGKPLVIPVNFSIGLSWGDKVEFKNGFPDETAVSEALEQLGCNAHYTEV